MSTNMAHTAAPAAEREPVRELNPSDMRQVADTIPDNAFDFEDDDSPSSDHERHERQDDLSPEERRAAEDLNLDDEPAERPKKREKQPKEADEAEEEPEAEEGAEGAQDAEDGDEEASEDKDGEKAEAKDAKPDRINLRDDVTIVIDGHEVTGAEVKRGFLRHADYTRKTTEVAQERQQVQALRQQIQSQEGELAQILELATEITRSALPQPPNPALLEQPDGERIYLRAQALYNQELQKFEKLVQARQSSTEQMTAQQRAQQQELEQRQSEATQAALQNEIRLMQERIPQLRTREGWNTLYSEVEKYGQHYSLSPKDVASIQDHRQLQVLIDAMAYRKLQAAKPAAVKQAQAAPPIRPAARPQSGTRAAAPSRSAEDAFRRNPNPRTAAATLPDSLFD